MDPGSPPVNLPAATQQVIAQQQLDQPASIINRKLQLLRQQQQQQFHDSFDNLESDAVINMSQFNVTKANIVHPSSKSPLVQPKQPLKSNLKKNPAQSGQMPVSILKRFDSSERMYPFSRPNGLASASASMLQQHSQAAAHLCSASVNGGFDMGSMPRGRSSRGNYGDSVDYGYGMKLSKSFHSQPGSPVMHAPQIQPQIRKRVQFANIPPLNSSAGDLHLTGGFSPSSSKSSRHHNRPSSHHSHHHHHQKHHKHHGKRSHRRSSSTGNFNNMSMQAMPSNAMPYGHHHHHHHSHHNKRQNVRQLSNRSLNMQNPQIYSDSDYCCTTAGYGYPQGVDYGDYEDYEDNDYFNNTCSTCSSSTLTSSSNTTTSTDSDSEESDLEDDFGMMSLNAAPAMHQQRQRQQQLQFDQRSLQHQQHMMMQPRRPLQPATNSQGLKISYVDSLPLARTNPAPKAIKNKESKKKSGGLAKLKKKDNCVVS